MPKRKAHDRKIIEHVIDSSESGSKAAVLKFSFKLWYFVQTLPLISNKGPVEENISYTSILYKFTCMKFTVGLVFNKAHLCVFKFLLFLFSK